MEPVLLRYDYFEKKLYGAYIPGASPAFFRPLGCGRYIYGSGPSGFLIDWDGKSKNVTIVKNLYTVPPNNPLTHVDFAAPSPLGRLVGGVLPFTFCGSDLRFSIYRYDHKSGLVELTPNNTQSSTGILFNERARKMYRLDSCSRKITSYDWHSADDTICMRFLWSIRTCFTHQFSFSIAANEKFVFDMNEILDNTTTCNGMAIDSEGMLWTVNYVEGGLFRINPK